MKRSMMLTAAACAAICIGRFAAANGAHTGDLVGTSIGSDLLLDATFGDAGSALLRFDDDAITAYAPVRMVGDADGYWLLGEHYAYLGAATEELAIARLRMDGSVDTGFGTGGFLVAPTDFAGIYDIALGDAGRFYVVGVRIESNDARVVAVACFEADGSGCLGFAADAGARSLRIDGFDDRQIPRLLLRDGSLFVIGAAALSSSGEPDTPIVAKFDAATALPDAGFGTGSPAPGQAIFDLGQLPGGKITTDAAHFDGPRILVAGAAQSTSEGGSVGYVLAFDATDGAADAGFGDSGVAVIAIGSGVDAVEAKALAVRADGRIAVAANAILGASGSVPELVLAELDTTGAFAGDFAGGGMTHLTIGHDTDVSDLALRTDGSLVVAMTTYGLLPDVAAHSQEQSVAEFGADGAGPVSTASIAFDYAIPPKPPYSFATALDIDAADRVVLAGGHFYGMIGGTIISIGVEMTATRFVRDAVFADGFE
ncbi:MAG TPA: hypothetical protein VJX31_13170 [Casimicrobiaceae bacterium]|nr:hypothetical protein [Casimicrobiaceae bacterium]